VALLAEKWQNRATLLLIAYRRQGSRWSHGRTGDFGQRAI